MSTCLARLVEHSKFKKMQNIQEGDGSQVQVSMEIVYYIVIKCLVVKKKKFSTKILSGNTKST